MRNADGTSHSLTDLLTAERLRAARVERTNSRNLAMACKNMGDERNRLRAAADWASARRVEKTLAATA